MANMLDYIAWRGDILFPELALNDVDALIFSELSYIRYDGLVPETVGEAVPLKAVAETILSAPEPMERCRTEKDLQLLEAAANSPRFSKVGLTFYRNIFVPEEETQFSAVGFCLDDGSAFLAFRGTDGTLVGWKEDFNMSFQRNIPAQRLAQEYVQRFAAENPMPLHLGGHSKGGNLAVYAGAKCGNLVQSRISDVYNFDGPGFMQTMLAEPGYQQILPRVKTFLPQFSVFGMMLERKEICQVINSDGIGLLQHEPYTWQVAGKLFVPVEEVTEGSRFLDRTLTNWLEGMTNAERSEFFEGVFSLLMLENASAPKDVLRLQNILAALKTIHMDDSKRKMMGTVLQNLLESAKTVHNTTV